MSKTDDQSPGELKTGAFELEGADMALLFGFDWSSVIPSEIRLFGAGITETNKGDFLFDEEAAESVMDAFREQGMDKLPFDAAHGMLNPSAPPDSHKALGWFTPVIKDDIEGGGGLALFAANIEWTDMGHGALTNREFRFFSPALKFNAETRRITQLINVALTNIPATKNQRPLVLDALEAPTNENTEEKKHMDVLLSTLDAPDESSAVAKVGELQSFKTAVLSALDGADESEAAEKIANLSALAEEAIKAQAKLAEIEKANIKMEREAKLDALCKDGKLPPAQREFAEKLSDDQLAEFTATLSASVVSAPVEEPDNRGSVETLSSEEKKVAEVLGLSVESMLEEKKLQAKEGK